MIRRERGDRRGSNVDAENNPELTGCAEAAGQGPSPAEQIRNP